VEGSLDKKKRRYLLASRLNVLELSRHMAAIGDCDSRLGELDRRISAMDESIASLKDRQECLSLDLEKPLTISTLTTRQSFAQACFIASNEREHQRENLRIQKGIEVQARLGIVSKIYVIELRIKKLKEQIRQIEDLQCVEKRCIQETVIIPIAIQNFVFLKTSWGHI